LDFGLANQMTLTATRVSGLKRMKFFYQHVFENILVAQENSEPYLKARRLGLASVQKKRADPDRTEVFPLVPCYISYLTNTHPQPVGLSYEKPKDLAGVAKQLQGVKPKWARW
jgi:hypothetical protein